MKLWPIISLLSLTACNKLKPMPIGGTAILKPQALTALAPPLTGPQQVVAAGQSNMAYNPVQFTFAPFCKLPVSITNIAIGGSLLSRWDRGGDLNPSLITALKSQRPNVLLWYQGEADGGDPTYGARFSEWLDNVRTDSGLPQLIIIFAQLGKSNGNTDWDLTKAQQAAIHIINTYMIKTDDIPQDIDQLHYITTGGYNIIGQRFAQVFNTL